MIPTIIGLQQKAWPTLYKALDSGKREFVDNLPIKEEEGISATSTKGREQFTGMQPQYYVEDDHEPIIPKEMFLMVQEEMARRGATQDWFGRKKGFSANHAFSQMVYCADCREQFRRIHWNNRGKKSIVWRCITRLNDKDRCRARTVSETSSISVGEPRSVWNI